MKKHNNWINRIIVNASSCWLGNSPWASGWERGNAGWDIKLLDPDSKDRTRLNNLLAKVELKSPGMTTEEIMAHHGSTRLRKKAEKCGVPVQLIAAWCWKRETEIGEKFVDLKANSGIWDFPELQLTQHFFTTTCGTEEERMFTAFAVCLFYQEMKQLGSEILEQEKKTKPGCGIGKNG